MLVEVHHAKEPNFGFATPERPDPAWPDGFEHVADIPVDTANVHDALECAFHLTNHISKGWHIGPNCPAKCFVERPRSTSVGDMAVVDGKRFICEMVGWTEIAPDGS